MTTLYAQPYDISATGFYFESAEEYENRLATATNAYGAPVEEFEIQFINGDRIDAQLFAAVGVHQGNFIAFLEAAKQWNDDEKTKVIIAVGEGGYKFDLAEDDPNEIEIDMYECDSLRDLAMQFVDEGLYGDIPTAIANYLDYDAMARDLSYDYSMVEITGVRCAYRLG